jgi:quercetin dioxygenase-like cupin family protein
MRIARGSETPFETMANDNFSRPVRRRDLGRTSVLDGTALVVAFEAGVRNSWHSHSGGQILYVVDGVGRVGTRDGTVAEVRAGDLVEAPPDEEHWHGASEDAAMTHLALSFGEPAWFEPVSDG